MIQNVFAYQTVVGETDVRVYFPAKWRSETESHVVEAGHILKLESHNTAGTHFIIPPPSGGRPVLFHL